jgi:hypothetical protein
VITTPHSHPSTTTRLTLPARGIPGHQRRDPPQRHLIAGEPFDLFAPGVLPAQGAEHSP